MMMDLQVIDLHVHSAEELSNVILLLCRETSCIHLSICYPSYFTIICDRGLSSLFLS